MAIRALDHVNIRTHDPVGTIAFYRDVLGMAVQVAPGQPDLARGAWILDAGNRAVIHIGALDLAYPSDGNLPWKSGSGSGALHHVALACEDLPGMKKLLTDRSISFTISAFPQAKLTQIFLADPNGIILELNFHDP